MTEQVDENKTVEKEEFVPKAAAEGYKADMFKYKDKTKTLEAELNALRLEKEAAERERLEKNQEWESLYAKEKEAREALAASIAEKEKQFVDSAKINAVIETIGGFKKSEYNRFIDVNNLTLDEAGSINPESLAQEVNRIKQNYSELLKNEQKPTLPNQAPATPAVKQALNLNDLSKEQLLALYTKTKK
jgi:hypothetical protein